MELCTDAGHGGGRRLLVDGRAECGRRSVVARTGIAANFLMTGLLIVLLIVFDRWTLALFLPEGSATLEVARHLNHIAIWSFLLFGVSFVVSGVVRATGAVIPPLLILAFSLWGVRVPLANVLLPHLGADAVWWSFPISSACSMLLSLAYYRWGGWRKARMLTTPTHPAELAAAAEVPAHPASPVADPAPLTDAPGGPRAPQR